MRILQVLADSKWTGPADPVLMLSRALKERGHDVTLVVRRPLEGAEESDTIVFHATQAGVPLDVSLDWDRRTKPDNMFGVPGIIRDTKRLRELIDRVGADVVNAHSDHDHLVCGRAIAASKKKPVLVRTDHKRHSIPKGLGSRFLINRYTDGIITFSKMGLETISRNFDFPKDRIFVTDPALDLKEWAAGDPVLDMRQKFKIQKDALVVGMVARFQKYRKTDVVISAFSRVVKRYPDVILLLLGRSSQMEESVFRPIRKKGIEKNVITPGYIRRDYRDALMSMDIFLFMMPGSDGTARALREAMALGLPVIAAKVGMVPELFEDGVAGLLVEANEVAIEAAITKLIEDKELRRKMGGEAKRTALSRFDLNKQAGEIEKFYRLLFLEGKGKNL